MSAQKLKGRDPAAAAAEEGKEKVDTGDLMSAAEVQEAMNQEEPQLERSRTGSGRSLASEALEKKQKAADEYGRFGEVDHNMVYLFGRMGEINRSDLFFYVAGACASIGEYYCATR